MQLLKWSNWRVSALSGVVLTLLLVVPPATIAASPAAQVACPIVLGAAVHETGPIATYDFPPVEGERLAVKELNATGGLLGCQLQLLELDGQSDPSKVGDAAVVAVQQGAKVLIAPADFDYGSPVSKVAQQNGLVGISENACSPLYSSLVLGDKQFTMCPWTNVLAAASAQHACEQMGWKRAVTIVDNFIDFTKSLGQYWIDAYQHDGCQIVQKLSYTKGEMTFDAQAQSMVQLGDGAFDVVLLAEDQPDAAVIARSIRAAGLNTPIVGSISLDSPQFYQALGDSAGNNIFVTTSYWVSPDGTDPKMDQFIQSFRKENNKDPEALTVAGYNLIQVLAQAITTAGSVDGPSLAKAMEGTPFDVIGGTFTWSDAADGHVPNKPLVIVAEQGGQLSYGGSAQADYVPPIQR
jgi:branched-chain amino acid transport system substrate-binding protein